MTQSNLLYTKHSLYLLPPVLLRWTNCQYQTKEQRQRPALGQTKCSWRVPRMRSHSRALAMRVSCMAQTSLGSLQKNRYKHVADWVLKSSCILLPIKWNERMLFANRRDRSARRIFNQLTVAGATAISLTTAARTISFTEYI